MGFTDQRANFFIGLVLSRWGVYRARNEGPGSSYPTLHAHTLPLFVPVQIISRPGTHGTGATGASHRNSRKQPKSTRMQPLNPVWTSVAAGSATHCPYPPVPHERGIHPALAPQSGPGFGHGEKKKRIAIGWDTGRGRVLPNAHAVYSGCAWMGISHLLRLHLMGSASLL